MDSEDEPLLLQAMWDFGEDEEQADNDELKDSSSEEEVRVKERAGRGAWWVLGWIYTRPWASGVVLLVGFLFPFALSTYMFLYCEPLDIDLSYSAFEVRSHSSAERFDALAIALKSQFGAWDRHRRDAEGFDFDADALRDLLLLKLNWQGKESVWVNGTERSGVLGNQEIKNQKTEQHRDDVPGSTATRQFVKMIDDEESNSPKDHREANAFQALVRKPRLAAYSYLQSQALWRMELVFVARGDDQNNIFTPDRLQTVHRVERLIMQHPQFQRFCWKPLEVLRDLPLGPSYCSPPSSLLSYLFPSERGGKIYFDGMGLDLADIHGESNVPHFIQRTFLNKLQSVTKDLFLCV